MRFLILILVMISQSLLADEAKPKSRVFDDTRPDVKPVDSSRPAVKPCDPKKSVCEEPNPEMYKKFEAYQGALDKKFEAYQQVRGDKLKAAGWKEIARCDDGHTWAYVLEKGGDYLKCEGINARGGPEDHPCVPFTADLDKFKAAAAKKKKECWEI